MFRVIEKETGKRLMIYSVEGDKFLVGANDRFSIRYMTDFIPELQAEDDGQVEATACVFTTTRSDKDDLDNLLADIASGAVPVELGDTISTRLLDGTEVDLVVTDQDDETVRLESRDCLGINTSARELSAYLCKVYDLLPDALKKRIVEVDRVHLNSDGERYTERCKLFVPAASEMFPPDECYGDEGLYQQMDWYKDVHNRVRADRKGGGSHWYWTSSPGSGSSDYFCSVSSNGNADYSDASGTYGLAPFGCIISKT